MLHTHYLKIASGGDSRRTIALVTDYHPMNGGGFYKVQRLEVKSGDFKVSIGVCLDSAALRKLADELDQASEQAVYEMDKLYFKELFSE